MSERARKRPVQVRVPEPSVLVLHEKHGQAYFHVVDDDDLFAKALEIVTARYAAGYWYYDPTGERPKDPGMTKEQVEVLPEGPIKQAAVKQLRSYLGELQQWRRALEMFTEVSTAVTRKDGAAAWQVLRDRSDGEYQRVSLERYCGKYGC